MRQTGYTLTKSAAVQFNSVRLACIIFGFTCVTFHSGNGKLLETIFPKFSMKQPMKIINKDKSVTTNFRLLIIMIDNFTVQLRLYHRFNIEKNKNDASKTSFVKFIGKFINHLAVRAYPIYIYILLLNRLIIICCFVKLSKKGYINKRERLIKFFLIIN